MTRNINVGDLYLCLYDVHICKYYVSRTIIPVISETEKEKYERTINELIAIFSH